MKIPARINPYFLYALMLLLSMTTVSCDKNFFEGEDNDCEVTYAIRFEYDMNLKWANAFPSEVKSVNLYVFDDNGLFIKEYTGRGEELESLDYRIMLDLPGNKSYKFLAWCGLDNEGVTDESFFVPTPVEGVTHIEELTCTLSALAKKMTRTAGEYDVVSDRRLDFLYHGYIEEYLEDNFDGTHYEYTIYLTKDTNHIRVMLQQSNGNLSVDDFDISMEAADGELAWNNELIGTTMIRYTPWNMEADVLGVTNSNGNQIEYYGVIADLSTSRLMYEDVNNIFLVVKKKDTGKLLFKVPMIQYSLTEREYYEEAYKRTITPQEFLDRQDEYLMTFFLDDNMNWLYAVIEIQQWRRVITNYDINTH